MIIQQRGGKNWYDETTLNTFGPITLLKVLKQRTAKWNNIEEYSYELDYGNGIYLGEYVKNVRARLPKLSDLTTEKVDCVINENSCRDFLYDNLYDSGDNNSAGYWLSDATESGDAAFNILHALKNSVDIGLFYHEILDYATGEDAYTGFGIRPVITIKK